MTPLELLHRLNSRGVSIAIDGTQLLVDGPAGAVSADDLANIREHKRGLLQALAGARLQEAGPVAEPRACRARKPERQPQQLWPAAAADFVLLLAPDDLPRRFTRSPGVEVVNPERFLATLKREVVAGPRGPRARSGALQEDVRALTRFLLSRHAPKTPADSAAVS